MIRAFSTILLLIALLSPPAVAQAPDDAKAVYVSVQAAHIRAGPARDAESIGWVRRNEKLILVDEERRGRWMHVRRANGRVGYVHETVLANAPVAAAPVTAAPATAAPERSAGGVRPIAPSTASARPVSSPLASNGRRLLNEVAQIAASIAEPVERLETGLLVASEQARAGWLDGATETYAQAIGFADKIRLNSPRRSAGLRAALLTRIALSQCDHRLSRDAAETLDKALGLAAAEPARLVDMAAAARICGFDRRYEKILNVVRGSAPADGVDREIYFNERSAELARHGLFADAHGLLSNLSTSYWKAMTLMAIAEHMRRHGRSERAYAVFQMARDEARSAVASDGKTSRNREVLDAIDETVKTTGWYLAAVRSQLAEADRLILSDRTDEASRKVDDAYRVLFEANKAGALKDSQIDANLARIARRNAELGRFTTAEQLVGHISDRDFADLARAYIAAAFARSGRGRDAERMLTATKGPARVVALPLVAETRARQGKRSPALAALSEAEQLARKLKAKPEQARALSRTALAYFLVDRHNRAQTPPRTQPAR